MKEISNRIASLSPRKREILLQRLTRQKEQSESPRILPRKNHSEACPLSFGQQQLWLLHQLNPNSSAYNNPTVLRIQGNLQISVLERVLNEVVRRHEALRTVFVTIEGQPAQVIKPALGISLPVIDLRHLPEPEREPHALQLIEQHVYSPFDLSKGPLLRAQLLRLGEEEFIIMLAMHHITSDAWSIGVLSNEVMALYKAFSLGKQSPLQNLPVQYADYACWQRAYLQGEEMEKLLSYWKQKLGGSLTAMQLPIDRRRPAEARSLGSALSVIGAPDLSESLKALSQQARVSLFVTLLAAFKILLHRYSREDDIIVGSPLANRNRTELEEIIGYFVNTLVLRTDLSGQPSFRELLKRVRETTLDAFAHDEMPFEKLVEELQPGRKIGHNPLFQVMFQLNISQSAALEMAGLKLSQVLIGHSMAKFDLNLKLEDAPHGLVISMEYNSDLFEPGTIRHMIDAFHTLLNSIVANPDQRISELSLLTEAEGQEIIHLSSNNQTNLSINQTIHQLFERQVERAPGAIAIVFDEQAISYGELNRKANQLAHHLIELGVGPEVQVGVCIDRSIEMVISILAILKSGGVCLPLDLAYPKQRLGFMLEDSSAGIVLTKQPFPDIFEGLPLNLIKLNADCELIAKCRSDNPPNRVAGDNLAYVLYTSGSTGRPKGVKLPHRGLCNRLSSGQRTYNITETDRFLHKASFSFDISFWEIFWPLSAGACVVMARPGGQRDAAYLVDLLSQKQITLAHFPPPMLQVMLDQTGLNEYESLKRIFCGGETLPVELQDEFLAKMKVSLHNQYGPTETSVSVTHWTCREDGSARSVPIGHPFDNAYIYLLDKNLRIVPKGAIGELHVGGISLARGYLNLPDLTAERFIPDPFSNHPGSRLYRTGDLARHLPGGEIAFLGRGDEQVKVRGYRIELGEVEGVMNEQEEVRDAVVVVKEDEVRGKLLVGYVVWKEGRQGRVEELKREMKEKLPEYMVPGIIEELEEMPMTPNGKVDRRGLRAREMRRREVVGEREKTEIEEVVAGIWGEILGVEEVGVEDNFFDLGGHSLLATRVISEINDSLQLDLPLGSIFEAPTVAGFAEWLGREGGQAAEIEKKVEILLSLRSLSDEEVEAMINQRNA